MKRLPGYTIINHTIRLKKGGWTCPCKKHSNKNLVFYLLTDCQRIHWKNLDLEQLIQFANVEKKVWEERQEEYFINCMSRVIEVAKSLKTLRA